MLQECQANIQVFICPCLMYRPFEHAVQLTYVLPLAQASNSQSQRDAHFSWGGIKTLPLAPQVTGEAQYVDDLPLPNNALHAAFVLSTRPHAKILSIDSAAAEQVLNIALPALRKRWEGGSTLCAGIAKGRAVTSCSHPNPKLSRVKKATPYQHARNPDDGGTGWVTAC